jgi:uncharacterized membrane protein SirB2
MDVFIRNIDAHYLHYSALRSIITSADACQKRLDAIEPTTVLQLLIRAAPNLSDTSLVSLGLNPMFIILIVEHLATEWISTKFAALGLITVMSTKTRLVEAWSCGRAFSSKNAMSHEIGES